MSLIGTILEKILHTHSSNAQTQAPQAPTPPTMGIPSTTAQPVDVAGVLNNLAKSNVEKLNWQTSIVDLLKLLKLDSSLKSRQQLAEELGFKGDANDSASLNVWLQKQVLTKLKENGGVVPDALKH